MPEVAGTRQRMPRAEREERMLDAAEEVFGARGYRATSMEDIAERAGITKPLVYQYFGSKDGVYEACIERARRRLVDEIEAAVAVAPATAAMRIFAERYFTLIRDNRGAWWLLYGEAHGPALQQMRERNAELIGRLVDRVLDQSGIALPAATVELLAHVLVGAGEQAGRWWEERPDVPYEQVVDQFVAMANGAVAQAFSLGA